MFQTIQEANVSGLDGILIYVATTVPYFIPMLLFCIYLAVALIIYLGTRKFSGQGDIFAAFTASGFFIMVIGTIMSFSFGIINSGALATTAAITIISFILLFIRRQRD